MASATSLYSWWKFSEMASKCPGSSFCGRDLAVSRRPSIAVGRVSSRVRVCVCEGAVFGVAPPTANFFTFDLRGKLLGEVLRRLFDPALLLFLQPPGRHSSLSCLVPLLQPRLDSGHFCIAYVRSPKSMF